jgi:hypothetical protein
MAGREINQPHYISVEERAHCFHIGWFIGRACMLWRCTGSSIYGGMGRGFVPREASSSPCKLEEREGSQRGFGWGCTLLFMFTFIKRGFTLDGLRRATANWRRSKTGVTTASCVATGCRSGSPCMQVISVRKIKNPNFHVLIYRVASSFQVLQLRACYKFLLWHAAWFVRPNNNWRQNKLWSARCTVFSSLLSHHPT